MKKNQKTGPKKTARKSGKKMMKAVLAALFLLGGFLASGTAEARVSYHSRDSYIYDHDRDQGWERGRRNDDRGNNRDNSRNRVEWQSFRDDDRVVIRNYMVRNYTYECPRGYKQQNNRCFKRGHGPKKVRYVVGRQLPAGVYWREAPASLRARLQPAPYGHRYVVVDNDVLLMSEATKHIIDAVTLMSAVQ